MSVSIAAGALIQKSRDDQFEFFTTGSFRSYKMDQLKKETVMQLFRAFARFLLAIPLVLILILGGARTADASTTVLIHILACAGSSAGGVDTLVIYPTTGGFLITTDPITVAAAAQFCANGNAFYAIFDNGFWDGVVLYPGLK